MICNFSLVFPDSLSPLFFSLDFSWYFKIHGEEATSLTFFPVVAFYTEYVIYRSID